MKPGEIQTVGGPVELNAGRHRVRVSVMNQSLLPVGVGSHYHFYEVTDALVFDRSPTLGTHLDVPAGEITWFRPAESRTVVLVPYVGARVIRGFRGQTNAALGNSDG